MIRLEQGIVRSVASRRGAVATLVVDVGGAESRAILYEDLTGQATEGDRVLLNTTAVALGLGTGGVHFVVANLSTPPATLEARGHAMKLRYTPAQVSVDAVEERHPALIDALGSLNGLPVVVAGLHSALAPAALGIRTLAPTARIAYVATDGAALHLGFSQTVPALRSAGLIDVTVTAGQAVGGDHEAVNLFSALAACKAVEAADVVIVAMGPGNLGTATRWGFALLETAGIINTVASMDGRAFVAPRISFADPRERHRGVSHHTLTALGTATLARATVALPVMPHDLADALRAQMRHAGITDRHDVVDVDLGEVDDALRASPVPLRSMGRGFDDDPHAFRAAAAAGVLAARALG